MIDPLSESRRRPATFTSVKRRAVISTLSSSIQGSIHTNLCTIQGSVESVARFAKLILSSPIKILETAHRTLYISRKVLGGGCSLYSLSLTLQEDLVQLVVGCGNSRFLVGMMQHIAAED
jgi:hypothetical protein